MFRNYLTIAWRNLKKNKIFSFINIFGLSVGLTCCMILSLYIYNELSYDKHHKNGERIFQIGTVNIEGEVKKQGANSSGPLGRMLQQEYPEVQASARILKLFRDDKTLFQVKRNDGTISSFYETKGFCADSNFFSIVSFPAREGRLETALNQPNTVVISEQLAERFFGKESAIDKLVRISSSTHGDNDYKITGVFASSEGPTHLDVNFFMSFRGGEADGFANNNPSLVNNNMFYTYLLLKPGSEPATLESKFPIFVQKHLGEELKQRGRSRTYALVPISEIHLSDIDNNVSAGGNKTSLFILGSIAVLTLLIACINFMNLSTANSTRRAAEVGVRKVLGAKRDSLLRQFLGESLLLTFISFLFALVLTGLLFPLFEKISSKSLSISLNTWVLMVGVFIIVTLFTGLLAGSYPAFYLSSFKPIKVLKGRFTNSLGAIALRKGLVVFQFIISIALIVSSIVIANQMDFLRSADLGFIKDQQIVIPLRTESAKENISSFKVEIQKASSLKSIGATMSYPGISHPQDWLMYKQGETQAQSKTVFINMVDDDFLQTLGVKLVAGRLFSSKFPADTLSRFIINEEAVKQFGFASAEDALGKFLAFEPDGEPIQFTIVGVVKNFHFKDLHQAIQPIAFRMYNEAGFNYLVAHAQGNDLESSIASLEAVWKKLNPAEPFEYSFVDQDFQKNYEAENRQGSLINYFTLIAIIISCLGLFGLATFTGEQRTKEIGIRKVLGASVVGVVGLLSKDFLKLVLIAIVIGSPLAWYAMNKWLQNFAYQTPITWQVFALTTIIAIVIAFFTISFQAVKAALANPVKSLRTE